jgi:hypothetical protein
MKYLFIVACYPEGHPNLKIFDEIISPQNQKYCNKHGFKYIVLRKEHLPTPYRNDYTWNKIYTIKDLLDKEKLVDGDIIINQDVDMVWHNSDYSFEPSENKSLKIAIDSGNTFCHGAIGFRINEWTRCFINNVLDENRYQRLVQHNTIHEGFPNRLPTSHVMEFREQAMFYKLFGIKRHSQIPFMDLPNNGIHSDVTFDTIYSVDDFNKNVELVSPNYNVTIWPGETSDLQFYINKLDKKEDVYLRHFTGSSWEVCKNWI